MNNIQIGNKVKLNIAPAFPMKTGDGNLHEAGHIYKVLGSHGTLIRLSRITDCAKLMIEAEKLIPATNEDLLAHNSKQTKLERMIARIAAMQKELIQMQRNEAEICEALDGQPLECAWDALQHATEELEYLHANRDN